MYVCENLWGRDVVESNYGSMAYGDFAKELQATKKYGKEYTVISADFLRMGALGVCEANTDNMKPRHPVWMVPVHFAQHVTSGTPRIWLATKRTERAGG